GDIHIAINDPKGKPKIYPDRMGYSAFIFLAACSRYFAEDFIKSDQEINGFLVFLDLAGAFPWHSLKSQETDLVALNQAQQYQRVLPKVATHLRERGQGNLATITECIQSRMIIKEADIKDRAR